MIARMSIATVLRTVMMLFCMLFWTRSIPSYNPVMHPDYVPLMGVESPSESIFLLSSVHRVAYWSKYIESYVHNGISKANSLFSPKIHKSKLVKMLPDFAEDREYDGTSRLPFFLCRRILRRRGHFDIERSTRTGRTRHRCIVIFENA